MTESQQKRDGKRCGGKETEMYARYQLGYSICANCLACVQYLIEVRKVDPKGGSVSDPTWDALKWTVYAREQQQKNGGPEISENLVNYIAGLYGDDQVGSAVSSSARPLSGIWLDEGARAMGMVVDDAAQAAPSPTTPPGLCSSTHSIQPLLTLYSDEQLIQEVSYRVKAQFFYTLGELHDEDGHQTQKRLKYLAEPIQAISQIELHIPLFTSVMINVLEWLTTGIKHAKLPEPSREEYP